MAESGELHLLIALELCPDLLEEQLDDLLGFALVMPEFFERFLSHVSLGKCSHGQFLEASPKRSCTDKTRRKGAVFGRLDSQRVNSGSFRIAAHLVQQHRLSDTAQTHHQNALRGPPEPGPFEGNSNALAQFIAPC